MSNLSISATCTHSAVNFSQLDCFGFIPNSPTCLIKPPPTKKGITRMEDVYEALPKGSTVGRVVATAYVLSNFSSEEVIFYSTD